MNDEMMQIRELTIGAVLESTPWFAPEKSHGFILVPIETIDNYFEQGTLPIGRVRKSSIVESLRAIT